MNPAPIIGLRLIFILSPLFCLAVWLLFKWLASGAGAETAERKRILEMMESGKITSEEGTELLNAMGSSSALRGQEKFTRPDVVILVGVALVVLGFFLPWMYVNWTEQMPGSFPAVSGYQAGSHVGAIGWAVLIIACLSAVPVFITPKNFLYKISMLQIFLTLLGLVLVISVLIRADSNLGAGLIVCVAGFVIELCASAAKFKRLVA